jgi:vesicular inhibitory amino acid transporter
MLSSPFAVAQAGWMGAIIALIISASYAYASHLMAECVRRNGRNGDDGDGDGDGGSYEEVARAAFGPLAERIITALFYAEILGVLVGYCISVGDNLAHIFPAGLGRFELPGLGRGRNLMMFVAALLVLPTVWLRDLSALSFTSMWCIVTSCCLLLSVLVAATVDGHIGFSHPLPFLRVRGLPVAAGLYAFSFGGTSVFPSIYMSMEDPSKFSTVLFESRFARTSHIIYRSLRSQISDSRERS